MPQKVETARTCSLVPLEGDESGAPVLLRELPFFIGRHEECHMVLPGDGIMRKHAKIRNQDGEYFITDLATYQGTFVNGQSVVESQIKDGDVVRIGDHKMRVAIRDVPLSDVPEGLRPARKVEGPGLAESLREIGPGTWTAAVFAVVALGAGLYSWSLMQERERIRTQVVTLATVELREGGTELVPLSRVATASSDKPTLVTVQVLLEGVLVEAVNEGEAEVVCAIPEQGTRRFKVSVERARSPIERWPELKGTLTLGPFERTQKAQEYVSDGDRAWAAREDQLENRSAALRAWSLAVVILETLGQDTSLLHDVRVRKKQAEAELDDLWESHYSLLRQALNTGDEIRAREEAFFLSKVFPEGAGKRHDIPRVYLDQLKPR